MAPRFITIEKFSELTGYSQEAVRQKRKGGVWLEGGVIRKAPDGKILIDLEGYDLWVSGQGFELRASRL